MSYESQLQKFQTLGMGAIDRLVKDNSELFLSISEQDAAQKIVAITRLRANELPEPGSENDMYAILADILGELLRDGKLKVADYGLSVMGNEQYRRLVARVDPVESAPAAEDPRVTYADVIEVYSGPVHVFNAKMKTAWKTRFEAAVAAGVI